VFESCGLRPVWLCLFRLTAKTWQALAQAAPRVASIDGGGNAAHIRDKGATREAIWRSPEKWKKEAELPQDFLENLQGEQTGTSG
jgi:hypothetical protein